MPEPETYRGIEICQYDVPLTPFVWTHDETNGYGVASTMLQAMQQIDRHLSRYQADLDQGANA